MGQNHQRDVVLTRIALLANGGASWIAGAQYLHSLLAGNDLLAEPERAVFDLLLHSSQHDPADYADVRPLVRHLAALDFLPAASTVLSAQVRQFLRQIQHRKSAKWPRNQLPDLLRAWETNAVFPANERTQPRLGVRQISWIPDFQHEYLPQFFPANELRLRRAAFDRFVRFSDRVVVSNQHSLADAHRLFPQHREKFVVVPFTMTLGPDWQHPDPFATVRKYGLPEKFLLFPSQFWKHKNHGLVFEAVRQLRRQGLNDVALVCTGHPTDPRFPTYAGELTDFLRRHHLDGAVRVLGLLPRADQVQLLRAAAAVLQPSLFEGWSALLEDCRSVGKPVFASDIPMHHEQLTDRTVLFDPRSPAALAKAVAERWAALTPGPAADEAAFEAAYVWNLRDFARRFITLTLDR